MVKENFEVTPNSGTNDGSLKCFADVNSKTTAREASFSVAGGGITKQFNIQQAPKQTPKYTLVRVQGNTAGITTYPDNASVPIGNNGQVLQSFDTNIVLKVRMQVSNQLLIMTFADTIDAVEPIQSGGGIDFKISSTKSIEFSNMSNAIRNEELFAVVFADTGATCILMFSTI